MIKVFSGTANPALSSEVSGLLGIPCAKSEVIRFSNSEVRVRIDEDVKNTTCIVIQPTANPTDTNLIELFFFCDALRRMEAKKVIGIIPYFGYARQDIQHRPGECVSVNVIIRFLESIGFSKIYAIDLHDEATEGVFSIPFKNLSALPLLAKRIKKYVGDDSIALISPDQGGIERTRKFGEYLFGKADCDFGIIEKKRDLDNIHKSEATALYGKVEGKTVVLIDDLTTSGGTLINAAEFCIKNRAKRVVAGVVHHDFSPDAQEKLQASVIDRFFTTNTISLSDKQKFEKLDEVSVASLIADEIKSFL